MGYKSIQSQINRAEKVKDAMSVLLNIFGTEEEFTRKQATNALRGTGVSFDTIVSRDGATKTREEEFSITVSDGEEDYYLYTSESGKWTYHCYYETEAKKYVERLGGTYKFIAANNNDKRDINVKRYYYALTPASLKLIDSSDIEREKAIALAKLNKQMEELKKQIALIESL